MKFKLSTGDKKSSPEKEVEITLGLCNNPDGSVTVTSKRSDELPFLEPMRMLTFQTDGTTIRHVFGTHRPDSFFRHEKTNQGWSVLKTVDEQWPYANRY